MRLVCRAALGRTAVALPPQRPLPARPAARTHTVPSFSPTMAKASTSAAASGAVARRPSGATTVQRKPAGEAARGRAMARMRGGAGVAAAIARRARWAAARGRDPPARDRGPAAAPAAGAAIASRARAALPRRRPPGDAHIRPGRAGRERPPVGGAVGADGGRTPRPTRAPAPVRARPPPLPPAAKAKGGLASFLGGMYAEEDPGIKISPVREAEATGRVGGGGKRRARRQPAPRPTLLPSLLRALSSACRSASSPSSPCCTSWARSGACEGGDGRGVGGVSAARRASGLCARAPPRV